jgi:hypothetical protein
VVPVNVISRPAGWHTDLAVIDRCLRRRQLSMIRTKASSSCRPSWCSNRRPVENQGVQPQWVCDQPGRQHLQVADASAYLLDVLA